MPIELYLIAPAVRAGDPWIEHLASLLEARTISALLVPQHGLDLPAYEALLASIMIVAQPRDCAVLAENDPELARRIGADGVHITTGLADVKQAIKLLQPDLIVGAGPLTSRHDAMEFGEAGADYLLFGGPDQETAQAVDLATWWAETFAVPSVLYEPAPDTHDSLNCEFAAFEADETLMARIGQLGLSE